jgi:uncharacterized OB-fold protein
MTGTTDPEAAGPEYFFQTELERGRFLIQRSRSSGDHVFYPRCYAPGTGTDDLEWVEPSGLGTVYSTTIVPKAKNGSGGYNISLVDLAEGPRMLTRVVSVEPEAVKIGMAVKAFIGEVDGTTVVLFKPVDGEQP